MRLALVLLLTFTAFAANEHPAVLVGIYEGTVADKGGANARKFTLTLERDGKATMKVDAVTMNGAWTASVSELQVQFEGKGLLVWHVKNDRLIPKSWDKADYGKKGLAMRKPH